MDILHDLWAGTGEAFKLIGEGTGFDKMKSAGEYIGSTEFAKPDTSQYYGTQDRLGRVVDGIFQAAPLTLGLAGTTAVGALAGPVGAGMALTAGLSAVGKGTFDISLEEIQKERPELSSKEQFDYALINAVSEVGSEGLGFLLPFGIGKLAGKAGSKAVLKALVDSGKMTSKQAIGSVVKEVGAKNVMTGLFGGAVADGASEVGNELVQAANREAYGMEGEKADLIDLFLIGSAPGGIIAGGTMAMDQGVKSKVQKSLEAGLQSESFGTRQATVDTITSALSQIHPDVGSAFKQDLGQKALVGPVSLQEPVRTQESVVETEILNKPEEVLAEVGIPTKADPLGTAEGMDRADLEDTTLDYSQTQEGFLPDELTALELENQKSLETQETVDSFMKNAERSVIPIQKRVVTTDAKGNQVETMVDGTIAETSVPLYDALILDNARSQAIKEGMEAVLVDANKLSMMADLDGREKLQKSIAKRQKQINSEVQEHVKETEVVVPTEQGTVEGIAEVVSEEEVKVEPKTPEVIAKEVLEDTVVPEEVLAEQPVEPVEAPPQLVEEEVIPEVIEEPVGRVEEAYISPETDVPMDEEQSTLAMEWMDKDIPADDAILLAKRATPVSDGPVEVEEYRDGKKYTGSRFTDGSTIEVGRSTKGKQFKVSKDGKVYRAGSRKAAREGIEGKRELELWEDKVREKAAEKTREKLSDKQKTEIDEFIVANSESAEGPKQYTEAYQKVTKGMKMDDKMGMFAMALGDVAQGPKELTAGNIREKMQSLAKAEENTTDTAKIADEGGNVAMVSTDTLFESQEKAAQSEQMTETQDEDVASESSMEGTKEEDESTLATTEDPTQYTQEDKGKYTLKKIWYTISGKKVAKNKKGSDAVERLETPDGRYEVVLAPREKGEPAKVLLLRNGENAGPAFNNPDEAMEFAKMSDEYDLSPDAGSLKDSMTPIDTTMERDNPDVFHERFKAWGHNMARVHKASREITNIIKKEGATPENIKALRDIKELRSEIMAQRDLVMGSVLRDSSALDTIGEVDDILKAANAGRYNNELGTEDYSLEGEAIANQWRKQDARQLGIVRLLDMENRSPANEDALQSLLRERDEFEVDAANLKAKFPDGLSLLESVANEVSSGKVEKSLAKMLLANVPHEKLKALQVVMGHKNSHKDGLITLRKDVLHTTRLHEVVHGITVAEMAGNKELNDKVTKLRREVRDYASKKNFLSPADITALKALETSEDFVQSEFSIKNKVGQRAYGLLNNKEFLSMAFANPEFQSMLKGIKVTEKRSLWDKLVDFIGNALGLKKGEYNMLSEVLTLGTEIAQAKRTKKTLTEEMEADFPVDTEKATAEVMAGKGPKAKMVTGLKEQLKNIKNLAEHVAKPVSDMLLELSPKLHGNLMKFESKLIRKQKEYSTKADPFMRWYKSLSESEQTRYDFALFNSNTKQNQEIIKEIPKEAYAPMKEILDDLRKRQEEVGLGGTQKDFYFPRRVDDVVGLMDHLLKDEEMKGPIGYAMNQEAKRLGVSVLTEDQKAQVVTDMLQAGHFRQLPRPGASKQRTIPFVTAETKGFYSNASESLLGHIFEMNEKIGQREFIGGSTRKADIQTLMTKFKAIEGMEEGIPRELAMAEYDAMAGKLEDLEGDLSNRLGSLISEEMGTRSGEDQQAVTDLINARLRQKGAHGVMDAVRNVGYIATMGNFLSALTQLGDIPILFYAHGINTDSMGAVKDAFSDVFKIAKRELTGKGGPTGAFVEEADFTNQLREFSQGKITNEWVEKAFKYSGLKFTDLIGKEAFMKAAHRKYQRAGEKEGFMKKYEPFFGKDTENVWDEMQTGKKTNDVMTVLISELSEFQPVTLSQQSKGYLGAGNMRMLYMLKTFTLRATSAAMREGAKEMKKGNYAKGAMKVSSILMIYAAAGAGADELKDLIRGKDSTFTDNTMDNLLQMLFMSKYTLEKGMTSDSVVKTLMANLLPPVRYADSFIADVYSLASSEKEFKAKTLSSVPMIGTIAYGRSSAGQSTYANQEKQSILDEVKKNRKKGKGAYSGNLSKKIRKYNKGKAKEDRITSDSVSRAFRG